MARAKVVELAPRDKILDAAQELFARRGFAGVGLSEIAEAVGLGKSSLFHHFHGKAALYAAVAGRILAHLETVLTRALAAGGTPVERLDRWLDTLIDTLAEHPSYSRLLLRGLFEDDELTGELDEERDANQTLARIIESIAALLREGMASGELRRASIPHTLQSLIGLTIYHFASGDFGAELIGRPLFAPAEVRKRQEEIKSLLHQALVPGARFQGVQG
jgi:AcrR family transcriptional regulator